MQKLKVDKQKKDKVKGCPKCKERRSFWILADATVGQKSLKLNFFFGADELAKNFGETLDRIHQLVQDCFGFSFSMHFV